MKPHSTARPGSKFDADSTEIRSRELSYLD